MTVFPQGTLIWQRFTNVSCVYKHIRENRRDSFDPQRVNLLGEDTICLVILLETPRMIVFLLHDSLASVVSDETFCFV